MPSAQRTITEHKQVLIRCVDIVLKRKPQGMTLDELYNALVSYPSEAVILAVTALGVKPRCRNCGKEKLRYLLRNYRLHNHVRPIISIPAMGAKQNAGVSEPERWVNVERMAALASSGVLPIEKVIADLDRTAKTLIGRGNKTIATATAIAAFSTRLSNREIFQQPSLLGEGVEEMSELFSA